MDGSSSLSLARFFRRVGLDRSFRGSHGSGVFPSRTESLEFAKLRTRERSTSKMEAISWGEREECRRSRVMSSSRPFWIPFWIPSWIPSCIPFWIPSWIPFWIPSWIPF